MAYQDDLLNAAQRRRARTGNSYFPAANTYRGININAGPSANAINSTPQGQTIMPSRYGTSSAVLPPDQNPAYQAALARGRVNRNDMTTVYLPSGGTMQVQNKSLGGTLAAIKGSTVQPKTAYASDYAKGYGAPTPVIQGGYQIAGGVANPIENLTPQQRVAGGVGTTSDYWKTNPSLNAVRNSLPNITTNQQYASNIGSILPNFSQIGQQFGTLARNVAGWFGGGASAPSIPPSANAGVPSPSPTPYQTPNPTGSPTPSPTIAPQFSPSPTPYGIPNPSPNESMSPPPIQGQMAPTNQGFGVPFRTSFSTAPADTGRVLMANEVRNPQFNPNQFYGANPAPTPRRYSDYGYY